MSMGHRQHNHHQHDHHQHDNHLDHLVEVEHVDGRHLAGWATWTSCAVKAGHLRGHHKFSETNICIDVSAIQSNRCVGMIESSCRSQQIEKQCWIQPEWVSHEGVLQGCPVRNFQSRYLPRMSWEASCQHYILNIGGQKYLGKRTQSQPNSSKSMVSGHMQHSVVPGSCSSLHVRCAVLFVRARQAVRLMSSCIYGACADSIAPISISSCSAVRETTLTTMPRFSSGLFTQILFSGSSLSLWISIGVVVLIFLAVRYRAILFVFHCRVLTTLWEIVAGWFIIAPPPFSEWSDSPGQVKQVKWDPSATVGSQFDLVVFCMGEWHCLALLVNRHKIHLEYNWSQNKPGWMCQ